MTKGERPPNNTRDINVPKPPIVADNEISQVDNLRQYHRRLRRANQRKRKFILKRKLISKRSGRIHCQLHHRQRQRHDQRIIKRLSSGNESKAEEIQELRETLYQNTFAQTEYENMQVDYDALRRQVTQLQEAVRVANRERDQVQLNCREALKERDQYKRQAQSYRNHYEDEYEQHLRTRRKLEEALGDQPGQDESESESESEDSEEDQEEAEGSQSDDNSSDDDDHNDPRSQITTCF